MPIYEYECDKCGVTFETMQGISAKPLKTCKGLGCDDKENGKVRRLVSASGFILKGSGWYTSEYPSEARKKGWEQESKQSKSGDSSDKATEKKSPEPEKKQKADTSPAPEKKPAPKSPYASGKSKKAKGSK